MRLLRTDPLIYVVLFTGTLFTLVAGYAAEQRTLMPIFNALVLWPFVLWALRHARIDIALRLVAVWVAVIFVGSLAAGQVLGPAAQAAVPGSVEYNAAYIAWLTGLDDTLVDSGHWLAALMHRTGLLLAGSVLTAGLVPLIAAARHLAILGLWTANLLNAPPVLALLLGIPPWTWAEMIGQMLAGAVLAEPLVTGDVQSLLTSTRGRLLLTGLGALLLAALLQAILPDLMEPALHLALD